MREKMKTAKERERKKNNGREINRKEAQRGGNARERMTIKK